MTTTPLDHLAHPVRVVALCFGVAALAVRCSGVCGGMVLGAALGGTIADNWGLTAPFWVGFAGSAVLLALVWWQLAHIAHADGADEHATRVHESADSAR